MRLSPQFQCLSVRELQEVAGTSKQWRLVAFEAFAFWRSKPGIYLVGGCCDGQHPANAKAVKTVRKYDVIGDAWIPCASLRKARDHLGLVGYQGRLHALGGWSGNGSEPKNRASCETYEPREDTWHTARHRLQTPRSGLAAAVSPSGTCFALAGWGGAQQGFLASAEILQAEPPPPISPGSSLASPRSPISRSLSIGAGSSSGAVKVEDGAGAKRGGSSSRGDGNGSASGSGGAASSSHSPQQGIASLSQVPVPPSFSLHMARHCPAAAALGRHLYLTGGSGTSPDAEAGAGAQPTSSVERLDMEEVEKWIGGWHRAHDPPHWEAGIARMLLPRYRHALAAANGRIYACGGQKVDGRATASVEVYDPAKDEWQEVRPMNKPRFSHSVAELDGKICARRAPMRNMSTRACACIPAA